MASTDNTTSSPAAEPRIEVTINTKPSDLPTNDTEDGPEKPSLPIEPTPNLARQNSFDSNISVPRPTIPHYAPGRSRNRRDFIPASPSPTRLRHHAPILSSSTHLLDRVSTFDGIADLPFPARSSIYLTTYPCTAADVRKWSWLFSRGVEDKYLSRGRSFDSDASSDDDEDVVRRRHRRSRSPFYDSAVDVPSVYLSRALDIDVVPEDTPGVAYLVVSQNRHQGNGSKLQVVQSRKAAGIVMYYEALRGDSVLFVGAVLGWSGERVKAKCFRRAESLEELKVLGKDGLVGVVC